MVAVLLLPVALILAVCLLERLERYVVARSPVARRPVTRSAPLAVEAVEPIAEVVALHAGPRPGGTPLDGATLRLRRTA